MNTISQNDVHPKLRVAAVLLNRQPLMFTRVNLARLRLFTAICCTRGQSHRLVGLSACHDTGRSSLGRPPGTVVP